MIRPRPGLQRQYLAFRRGVNRHLSFAQRQTAAASEHALDFGNEGQRDFLRRFGAQVQSRGCEKSGVNGHAKIKEVVEKLITAFSWTNQAYVTQIHRQQFCERGEIASVVVRL